MKWKEIICLGEKVYLKMPEDWNRPTNDIVEKIFPYRQKPQEIYASQDTDHIITLNILDKELQEKQIYPAIFEIKRLIGHMYPESIKEAPTLIRTEAGKAGYFSYITGGIKSDYYHYMFVLPIRGKLMVGSSHFPKNHFKKERLLLFDILKSIKPNDNVEDIFDRYGESGVHRQNNIGP